MGVPFTGFLPVGAVPALLADLSRGAGTALARAVQTAGLGRRGVWTRDGRHHIEVHGVAQAGTGRLARAVERALHGIPGVLWARVNAPSGRVVVAVRPDGPPLRALLAAIQAAERADSSAVDPEVPEPHPPEEGPRTSRAMSTMAADALGLTLSAATRVLPFIRLPGEVAGLLSVVDLHPKLRELAGRGLRGDHRAESVLPLAGALTQGLTGGWAGIVLDGAQRVLQWREARAQLATWERAEEELSGSPDRAAASSLVDERPVPKPDSAVERYIRTALATGALAGVAALPFTGGKRAAALGLSSLPKAAVAGREGYAAQLGQVLARRGVIAMDRSVLRELDRIDTLVLDERILHSDRGVLTDLVPRPGCAVEEAAAQTFTLFDPAAPADVQEVDGWRLGPVDESHPSGGPGEPGGPGAPGGPGGLSAPGGEGAPVRTREWSGTMLGLTRSGTLAATVTVAVEPAPGSAALIAAARRAGLRIVVATGEAGQRYRYPADRGGQSADQDQVDQRYGYADAVVPGGDALACAVRRLQARGAVVALVSADGPALAAADCGLGVRRAGQVPPWGAHLLVGLDLEVSALVVEAAGVARTVVRQSIALAGAGSGLGALTALTASRSRLPGAAVSAVNAAASVALANGVWRALRTPAVPAAGTAPDTPWHLMPVEIVLTRLDTSPDGLTGGQARDRHRHRPDRQPAGTSLARAFLDELSNPLTPVLVAGAGLSAAVGSMVDAALVGGVVGVSALIGAGHRVRTERSLAALLSRSAVTARVRRDGAERVVPAEELVVGDIIAFEPGDAVPADCRILHAAGLETDESSLTGESLPVAKTSQSVVAAAVAERRSMVYEGTTIAAGRGLGVVVATGADTEVGRGVALADQGAPVSGVEARLSGLTRTAIPLAATSAVAVAGAGLAHGVPLAASAATAANLAVASVPEGLPFLVGAAQLAAARRLAGHGALVRNPRTIEALGRVDVLCFDKTGTLTEGRLLLAGVGDGDRYAPVDRLNPELRPVLVTALRATPHADRPEEVQQQTDRAVLVGARTARVGTGSRPHPWHPVSALPFEPSRGYHAAVGGYRGEYVISVKGAPETILPRCAHRRNRHGEVPLDEPERTRLQEVLTGHAGAGQRILAVAERRTSDGTIDETDIRELTFVGLLALADGVRDSAAPAVDRIRRAGVHTIMITGDHPATAAAIAQVISPEGAEQRVVTATELDGLDDVELGDRLVWTDVVARCTPAHKVRLIQALQRCGRTVAMTGDGANDAPAIRLADVGIALGRRGTPAARAAADLVVTDDRLETIIATLIEGRAMWTSVRHALGILVGGNLGEIAFSVLTAATTGRSALNGRQLLLVNLLTDLAPAMAIAIRPPSQDVVDGLLTEGPETSLGAMLTREITLRAGATALGATTGWTLARLTGRRRRAGTVALASLVGTQLGQTLLEGGRSPAVLGSTAGSLAVLAAVIQTPGVSQFFGCTPLGPVGWGIAAGSAAAATIGNAAAGRWLARGSDDQGSPGAAAARWTRSDATDGPVTPG